MRVLMAVLFLAGCGSTPATREPDEYTGCGTDENWRTFEDQEPSAIASDDNSPQLTMPAASAVPAAPKPVFAWNQDASDPGTAGGDVAHDGPGCNDCCPQYNLGALTTLHLPPISGDVYDLQFSVGGAVDHRLISTLQEWTPADAVWAGWQKKSVSLRIYRMTLIKNDVRPGTGGPYVATQPFTFTVGG